jgi:hypothetical protein
MPVDAKQEVQVFSMENNKASCQFLGKGFGVIHRVRP